MKKRGIIYAIIGFVVVIVGIGILNYFASTTAYTITFVHTSSVKIVQMKTADNPVAAIVNKSGDTVRLSSNLSYMVSYIGSAGYASGTVVLAKESNVSIDPDFSEEKYTALITQELPSIRAAITERYPKAGELFTIDQGAMREKGLWFVADLVYNGEYSLNSDNLRVLLKQENGHWSLMTEPDIILTTIHYPRVPVAILSWANSAF